VPQRKLEFKGRCLVENRDQDHHPGAIGLGEGIERRVDIAP
jgi:hypothetical protein